MENREKIGDRPRLTSTLYQEIGGRPWKSWSVPDSRDTSGLQEKGRLFFLYTATYVEAVTHAQRGIDEWIAVAQETGRAVPEPRGRVRTA